MNRREFVFGAAGGVLTWIMNFTGARADGVVDDILSVQKDLENRKRAFDAVFVDKMLGYDKPYSMLFGFVALDCPNCQEWLNQRQSVLSALADKKRFFLHPVAPSFIKNGRSMPMPVTEVIYAMMLSKRYGPTSRSIVNVAKVMGEVINETKSNNMSVDQVFDHLSARGINLDPEVRELMGTDAVLIRYWKAVDVFLGMDLDVVPVLVSLKPERAISFAGNMDKFMALSDKILSLSLDLNIKE